MNEISAVILDISIFFIRMIAFPDIGLLLLLLAWLLEEEVVVWIRKHIITYSSWVLKRHSVLMLEEF